MAIKVSGNTVIDDSRNLVNVQSITFDDATVQTTAAGGGGGGTTIYEMGDLIHTFDNPNVYGIAASDYFGQGVAITDKYYLIAAYDETSPDGYSDSGMVYVYDRKTNNLVRTLINPSTAYANFRTDDQFGQNIAAHGKYAVIGAIGEDTPNSLQGAAYIYDLDTGSLLHSIASPAPDSFATFGDAVALFGNYAAIAAPNGDDPSGTSGTAFEGGAVFIYNIITGELVKTIANPNDFGTTTDRFGASIALYENYLAVGAEWETAPNGGSFFSNSGKVYVFNAIDGDLLYTIDNPNDIGTPAGDFFSQVAIHGNYLAVGAYGEGTTADSGRVYVYELSTGNSLFAIDNPNAYSTSGGDQFGNRIALTDGYLIATAPQEGDASGSSSGKAYIFDLNDNGALLFTIDNPNPYGTSAYDQFGLDIGVYGSYLIVGSSLEDDTTGDQQGKAFIFAISDIIEADNVEEIVFDNGYTLSANHKLFQPSLIGGELAHTLDNPNAFSGPLNDLFGGSVAISGNYAIVGAYQEDDSGGSTSGKAYIFNVTTGALLHTLDNPNAYSTSSGDAFGTSVAISGNYSIVGAPDEDDAGGTSSGKAYIFNVTTGALLHTLNNPNAYSTSGSDEFGGAVAISGKYAIVGAYKEDDAGGTSSGKAYVFNVETGALKHTINNPNGYSTSASDNFGYSVGISGGKAIVGARWEDDAGGSASGKAYIFDLDGGGFDGYGDALIHTLDNPNDFGTSADDNFGYAVAIDGNYAIVGAWLEDDATYLSGGKAYIFDVTTGNLLHTLDNPDDDTTDGTFNDRFGSAVSVSGNYAIVGAYYKNVLSGKAYIFDVTTGDLLYTLDNPNVDTTDTNDEFGRYLAISGNYAIVGAPDEDEGAQGNSGKAYIFSVTNQTVADRLLTLAKS